MDPSPRIYDVGESIWLNAFFLAGSTSGSILRGQQLLLVKDPADLDVEVGADIVVVGAGALGGDLVTTVSAADGQQITLADAALQAASLVTVGNPATPGTVECRVQVPGQANDATPAVTLVSEGRYRALFTTTVAGDHFYRFIGTGAATADRWRKFVVRPQRVPAP
jgi:hypothetical protein